VENAKVERQIRLDLLAGRFEIRGWAHHDRRSATGRRFERHGHMRRLFDDGKINRLARALAVYWRIASLIALSGRMAAMRCFLKRRPAACACAANENGHEHDRRSNAGDGAKHYTSILYHLARNHPTCAASAVAAPIAGFASPDVGGAAPRAAATVL